jgi:two-component system sensor histidine kinase ChiS
VGGQNRMNGTAISDAVNLAARIETLTKRYQTPLLVSHHALAAMSNPAQFAIRFIDRDSVKGRQQPVAVFEILDGLSEQERILKTAGRTEFETAILLYHAGSYGEAAEALSDYVHRYPADLTAQFYLQRSTQQAIKPSV